MVLETERPEWAGGGVPVLPHCLGCGRIDCPRVGNRIFCMFPLSLLQAQEDFVQSSPQEFSGAPRAKILDNTGPMLLLDPSAFWTLSPELWILPDNLNGPAGPGSLVNCCSWRAVALTALPCSALCFASWPSTLMELGRVDDYGFVKILLYRWECPPGPVGVELETRSSQDSTKLIHSGFFVWLCRAIWVLDEPFEFSMRGEIFAVISKIKHRCNVLICRIWT